MLLFYLIDEDNFGAGFPKGVENQYRRDGCEEENVEYDESKKKCKHP